MAFSSKVTYEPKWLSGTSSINSAMVMRAFSSTYPSVFTALYKLKDFA